MKQIVFYRTASGSCPVIEFLDALPARQAQKIVWVLRLTEEVDVVPAQYFKKLAGSGEIWEVRVEFGGEAFRLLGFLHGGRFIVLNHAFRKKTQKIPAADIRLAEQRKADWLRRKR
jgi:phage-related protein